MLIYKLFLFSMLMLGRDLKPGNIAAKIHDASLESLSVLDLGQMIEVNQLPHVLHNDPKLCALLEEVGPFYPRLKSHTQIALPRQGFDVLLTFEYPIQIYYFCVISLLKKSIPLISSLIVLDLIVIDHEISFILKQV